MDWIKDKWRVSVWRGGLDTGLCHYEVFDCHFNPAVGYRGCRNSDITLLLLIVTMIGGTGFFFSWAQWNSRRCGMIMVLLNWIELMMKWGGLFIYLFIGGLLPSQPHRVTAGLFTQLNLTDVENYKCTFYKRKHTHHPKNSPFGIALIKHGKLS